MKPTQKIALTFFILFLTVSATIAQTVRPAPKLAGFSVQGSTFNLDFFKGKQSLLVVFYRTHN